MDDQPNTALNRRGPRNFSSLAAFLALVAALSFAAGTVLQQRGTMLASASDARFLVQILREPVWLIGALLQGLGWILQAAALDRGTLMLVQTLTTFSLVLALPLGAKLTAQRIGRQEVFGAILVVIGASVFLAVGTPSGQATTPEAVEWWTAAIGATVLVAGLAALGRRRPGAARAALFGTAAGIAYALQAAVTKVFVGELGGGVLALVTTWTSYALLATALVGFVLQQSALKTGVLAPAMGSSNAATLVFSVVFGLRIFDETIASDGRAALAYAGLVLAVAGVVMLAARTSSGEDTRREPKGSME
jgi:uncharacterized membrane protein